MGTGHTIGYFLRVSDLFGACLWKISYLCILGLYSIVTVNNL